MRLPFARRTGRTTQRIFVSREPVLGTRLEIVMDSRSGSEAAVEQIALAEITRLNAIFNAYEATSELRQWELRSVRQLEATECSSDLAFVLDEALKWCGWSQGAFHPATDELTRIWKTATSIADARSAAAGTAEQLKRPLYTVEGTKARKLVDQPLNLNSIAKGYVVDCLAHRLREHFESDQVMINLGGDIRHIGSGGTRTAIADPFHPADNAVPVDFVRLSNQAIATSGGYFRNTTVEGTAFSHLLDPRTGQPVTHVSSVSVLAPSALEADVLSTIASVLPGDQAIAKLSELPDVGVLIINNSGEPSSNAVWQLHRAPSSLQNQ